ncbi:ribonuclease [Kitasatospora sp. NPDC002227]|uniref:ribonuclease n=1 Tax=Kitasatospora sp. NPDC002227 TaxID=3154773 RepID=UPI00332C7E46
MSSRNRLIAVPAIVVLALFGASACASSGGSSKPSTPAAGSASPARSVTAKPSPPPAKPGAPTGTKSSWVPNNPSLADVCRSKLPSQARDTLTLIDKGGPYPYRNDGIVFENRENRLPKQATGYYHEYTVVTPGSDDRGARRVVTGSVGEEYWTSDHYASFQEIDGRC